VVGVTRSSVEGDKVTRPTVERAGASQPLFGNMLTGENGAGSQVGYKLNTEAFGSLDDTTPDPPGGASVAFDIIQLTGLTWEVSFSPGSIPQGDWTTLTLDNDIDAPVVLASAAATYAATVFTSPITTRWTFGATADILHKLGSGVRFSAVFA